VAGHTIRVVHSLVLPIVTAPKPKANPTYGTSEQMQMQPHPEHNNTYDTGQGLQLGRVPGVAMPTTGATEGDNAYATVADVLLEQAGGVTVVPLTTNPMYAAGANKVVPLSTNPLYAGTDTDGQSTNPLYAGTDTDGQLQPDYVDTEGVATYADVDDAQGPTYAEADQPQTAAGQQDSEYAYAEAVQVAEGSVEMAAFC
jgi:hypothetical protein